MRKLKLPGRDQTRPKLSEEDMKLINSMGIKEIKEQARKMVERYLKRPQSDKKVPKAGNPIYKAMHACNCTSKRDISRAHKISASRGLSNRDKESIANLLTRWVAREYNFFKEEQEMQQQELGDF